MSANVSAFAVYANNKKSKSASKKKTTTTVRGAGKQGNGTAKKKDVANSCPRPVSTKAKAASKPNSLGAKSAATKSQNKKTENGKPKGNETIKKDINGNNKARNNKGESFDDLGDEWDNSFETESADESDSGDDMFSSTYSGEYTMNSYSECDCTNCGEVDDEKKEEKKKSDGTFSLQALQNMKKGNKRKSNESENSETDQKQKRTEETNAKSTNARKSLPDATATAKNGPVNGNATKNQRRSLNVPVTNKAAKSPKADVLSNVVKLEALSPPENAIKTNSMNESLRMLRWMLNPLNNTEFFEKYWEKNVCLIKREQSNYYSHLISFQALDKMLLDHHLEFTKNIDITSYKNGVRETHNPEGRALPPVVWDHYGQGCSIRILNPQTFLQPIFAMNSTLQEYFHCMVGSNVYLTPPNSQGFAPHYDDIEAFVLQIEGRKRWRLYKPRNEGEVLPRFSSQNFSQDEIGKPILEEVLKPGDLLYFPRGTIHQATTEPGYHSLHITVSVYQQQSYADLFQHILPHILNRAITNNVELRRGLPLNTWREAGIAFSNNDTKERAELLFKISKLLTKTLKNVNLEEVVDAAVDDMAKKYQHEALPPHLTISERMRTVFGSRSVPNEQGECICDYEFDLRTNVRLLRAHILRLVREKDNKICLYFYAHNSKEYKELDPNFIEIDSEEASCIEVLLRSYPAFVGVSELPLKDDERKIEFAQALWERGLLMLEKAL